MLAADLFHQARVHKLCHLGVHGELDEVFNAEFGCYLLHLALAEDVVLLVALVADEVGHIYNFGYASTGKNYDEAMKWYKLSMEQEQNGYVACCLGCMYQYGNTSEGKDIEKALEYQLQSIELGHKYAYRHLGEIYEENGDIAKAKEAYTSFKDYGEEANNSEWIEWAKGKLDALN